ncbi:MAG: hypothetical protein PWP60_1264 [Candidatus Atribacteria bacterium]|nr:hypothetical protein [Candidatus Atribacteria bacterium]
MESKTKLFVLAGVSFLFLAISMIMHGAVLPVWLQEFKLSATLGGRLFFMYYLSYVILTFLSGWSAQFFGGGWVLFVCYLFLIAGFAMLGVAASFLYLALGMLLLGAGGGLLEAPLTTVISRFFPGDEGYALNLSQVFFGVGASAGPFLTGFLLSRGVSWRLLYILLLVVAMFLATLIFRSRDLFGVSVSQREKISREFLSRWKGFLGILALAMLLYVGAEIGSSSWMSTYLVRELQGTVFWGGAAIAVFWAMITMGRFLFAFLSRFLDYSLLLRIGSGINIISLLFLLFTSRVELALVAFGGLGLGCSGIWPLIIAHLTSRIEENHFACVGFVVGFGGLGALIFPYLFGFLGDHLGLRSIFFFVLVLSGLLLATFSSRFFLKKEA